MKMAEYIEREEIMNRLFTEYATDSKADVFELIRSIPAADVQSISVIKELQEYIKQRILETAFNNGGIYGEVAEDIANRIDIWVDEFGRIDNG